MGLHKPIYHPMSKLFLPSIPLDYFLIHKRILFILDDCGDHVVVINTADVALPGDEWKKRVYFHHTGYPGGASWTLAWQLHEKDPKMVFTFIFL